MKELLNEISYKTGQPTCALICLEYVIPVKQEQIHLLASYKMIRVCKLEKNVCCQKSKNCSKQFYVVMLKFFYLIHIYYSEREYTKKRESGKAPLSHYVGIEKNQYPGFCLRFGLTFNSWNGNGKSSCLPFTKPMPG